MKKTIVFLAFLSLLAFVPADKTLTKKERDFAVQYMEQTRDALIQDVKGLSDAQINFKADSTRWSVAQCVEHIAKAETALTMARQMNLSSPAEPSKRDSVKFTDDQILTFLTDRSHKFQAPEMLKPDGTFGSMKVALDSFVARRNRNIEFVKTTQEDLRDHYWTPPGFGTLDLYQELLFMTAHSKRHTLQLEEVKANPNFPKN